MGLRVGTLALRSYKESPLQDKRRRPDTLSNRKKPIVIRQQAFTCIKMILEIFDM